MMFAAGFGTRMKHLTQNQPKPLVKVSGRPLIDHALELARGVGPDVIVANLHYLPEMLRAHLEGSGVQTILETPDVLETGGGLRNALPVLGSGPVYTTNTDAIWAGPNPLALARDAWRPDDMDALLVCVPVDQAVGYEGKGDFATDGDGRIARGPGAVYGGVQIIKTDVLHNIKERVFSLNLIWDMMQKRGRLFGIHYPGRWCDVGHPGGITDAEAMIAQHNV